MTGEIRARYESDLGFRTDGRIIARPVDVGSMVRKGDVLAELAPQQRQQDLLSARAEVALATLLTLVFLPALYVAWFGIREPEVSRP